MTALADDVWTHLTGGSLDDLSSEAAAEILRLRFDDRVEQRVNELSADAATGALDGAGREELDRYLDAASLLGVLQIRARGSLRRRAGRATP